jgi:hypothetical protein
MRQSTTETTPFSPCASLAALGYYLQHSKLFDPVEQRVQSMQKTVKQSPLDKLYDAWIAILAGGTDWLRSTRGCAATSRSSRPSGAAPVPTNPRSKPP